jgi:hypothetical protein
MKIDMSDDVKVVCLIFGFIFMGFLVMSQMM